MIHDEQALTEDVVNSETTLIDFLLTSVLAPK